MSNPLLGDVLGWSFVAVRFAFLAFVIVGAFLAIRRSGAERTEVTKQTRNFLIYWGIVLAIAITAPALIYDHFRLWHWLFG